MGKLGTGSRGSLGTSNETSIPKHNCTDQLRQSQFACACMYLRVCNELELSKYVEKWYDCRKASGK